MPFITASRLLGKHNAWLEISSWSGECVSCQDLDWVLNLSAYFVCFLLSPRPSSWP